MNRIASLFLAAALSILAACSSPTAPITPTCDPVQKHPECLKPTIDSVLVHP
jgi:hypothetical protein